LRIRNVVAVAAVTLAASVITVPAQSSVFVGDLVYCDVNANGNLDAGEFVLNGVVVDISCEDPAGNVCFVGSDSTGGPLPAGTEAKLSVFDSACGGAVSYDPADPSQLDGRYLFEVTGDFNAGTGCFFGGSFPQPWTCTVSVDPSSLPSDCNVLVTPEASGFPFDGNNDGDFCDAEDGPFPEDQVLGNLPNQGGCENFPDPAPGDEVYTAVIDNTFPASADRCSPHNDFGYTGAVGGEGCTPGYWRNHLDTWVLDPSADFDTTFGVDFFDPDITLEDAVNLGGGGIRKLARHGTAALLNALNPDVNYPATEAEVIAAVQAGDIEMLVEFNELSDECPAE
jgi:hypothetical protein